ncbi:hypothetical protein FHS83_002657 [Rhizomicrobium palustre]|uniref:Uncharacterized protein n=1 Tax=Rhizomicrobium palustre TaxID=189966 RepID=A0A846N1H6_9PROT|nr:hypothetical protein [Rhizomicrobium palustre]NIK89339.1 hypothetical protein [Rhizomicrobium palustre]
MRSVMIAAALFACAMPALAAKPAKPAAVDMSKAKTLIGICFGQDAQYTQTLGGAGFIHIGNGDRTYQTQKLVQNFNDGKTICGAADPKAPVSSNDIVEVCATLETKTISVLYRSDNKPVTPKNASPICTARIDLLDQ